MNDIPAVLFDLDGTLADTAQDMGTALNLLLAEEGHTPIPLEDLRHTASHGGRNMVEYGFSTKMEESHLQSLILRFLDLYQQNLCVKTSLFPNVKKTLDQLSQKNIAWGIVTNKSGYLAEPLLTQLGIAEQAACRVYGDTTQEKKPSPMPLLHAADLIHRSPEHCLYVGDSERDIQAANKARMSPLFVTYGYGTMPSAVNEANDTFRVIHNISDIFEYLPENE